MTRDRLTFVADPNTEGAVAATLRGEHPARTTPTHGTGTVLAAEEGAREQPGQPVLWDGASPRKQGREGKKMFKEKSQRVSHPHAQLLLALASQRLG